MIVRRRSVVGIVAAAIYLFALIETSFASTQGPTIPPGPPNLGDRDPSAAMRANIHRESALRSLDRVRTAHSTADPREIDAIVAQIKQDFARIQVLRNELVRDLTAKSAIDFGHIAEQSAEINKRAHRLKYYLVPQPSAPSSTKVRRLPEVDETVMTPALVKLCNTIHTFVENPAMDLEATVDAEQAVLASHDLETIIDLSEAIRRCAGRVGKSDK